MELDAMVLLRYKGYSAYQTREPAQYKVLDGREHLRVYDERTGELGFTFVVFYNPKRILRPEEKEEVLLFLIRPALDEVRRKIDAGDLTDGFMHVDLQAAMPGGVSQQAPAQRG